MVLVKEIRQFFNVELELAISIEQFLLKLNLLNVFV